jgi:hypothetical protein
MRLIPINSAEGEATKIIEPAEEPGYASFTHRQDMLQNGVSSRDLYVYFLMEF